MLVAYALGYLLMSTRVQGKIQGKQILGDSEFFDNHFSNDRILLVCLELHSVNETKRCLDTFCIASSVVVSDHKFEFWLIGPYETPSWLTQSGKRV